MTVRHLFVALASICSLAGRVCLGSESVTEDDSAVVVVTNSNFDTLLKENDVVLVKFYAPWCGHCKRMAPDYAKAARSLKDKGSKIVLGKVDAVAETELATKHEVNEYPTLTLFRNQKPERYTGGRTAEAIVEWVEMMTGPAVMELEGPVKGKLTKESPVAFFGDFASKDADLAKVFQEVASYSRQVGKFYAKYAGGPNKVHAWRFEEGDYAFDGATVEDFKAFVEEEAFPLFGPINGENFRRYIEREASLVWFCGSEADFNEFKGPIREAAKASRKAHHFVWLDTESFKGHAEGALGISEFPGLVLQTKKGRYVLPNPSVSMKEASDVAQFLEDVAAGRVERSLKSEPLPESSDDAVKVVVGKTFEEVVLSESDVFLEVYAPWCGYCKSFEPIYAEFAEKLRGVDGVVVAKMDGTANESPVEAFDWSSFPTIFFVKGGTKVPLKYDGSRTVDGLMEFLAKNGSRPVAKKADKSEEL